MNNTVIYNGNHDDLFSVEIIDKVQVKSILTGELTAMEYLGNHEDPTGKESCDFGSAADCSLDFEIYKDQIKLFFGYGLGVIFYRDTNHMEFYESEKWPYKEGMIAQRIFPEIYLPRPKTMRAFIISISVFIAHVHNEGTAALKSVFLKAYERNNHWPYSTVKDADLLF